VKCWGSNEYGQLGNGTTTQSLVPTEVVGLTGKVIAISAGGFHTCALTSEGEVKCWGWNNFGQLGDGTTTQQLNPVAVIELPKRIKSIAAGNLHTCAITSKGSVKCWGDNQGGALGNGMYKYGGQLTPVDVTGLTSGVISISATYDRTCAVTEKGEAKCWGSGFSGELGNGTSVKCWGRSTFGGIGNGEFYPNFLTDGIYPTPVDVSSLTIGIRAIATGDKHTCALTVEGKVKCWGSNGSGQLGGHHTCALLQDGAIQCWGSNNSGQLGDGTIAPRLTPVSVIVQ
jgi:alpha-tubulin suppressor-like RCC1 family protein